MGTPRLDDVDRLILRQLTADVRITYADLAARVGLSESQCLRRVRTLERTKVIQGYITMVDPIALNLPICAFIEVRLHTGHDAQTKRFERAVDQRADVASCWRTSGDADYLLHAFVADPLGYERLLNALADIDGVEIIRTHLVLNALKRSPRFPLRCTGTRPPMGTALSTIGDGAPDRDANSTSHPGTSFDSPPAIEPDEAAPRRCLDELDRRILRTLANNGRMSNAVLAERIGLSPAPCLRRVRALEAAGVIQAYYVVLDLDALDLIGFWVMIRLKTLSPEWHENFARALTDVREIMSVNRTTGASDYILLCMASGVGGVEQVLANRVFSRPGVNSIQSALCLRYCNHVNLEKLHDVARRTEGASKERSIDVVGQVNASRKR